MMNVAKHILSSCLGITVTAAAVADAPQSPRVAGVEILADQGWADNPDVIWYDNFDGSGNLVSRYLEAGDDGGDFVPVSSEALGGSGKSVRARFQRGEVGAGGLKKTFGRNAMDYRGLGVRKNEDFEEIYWRHYVKHEDGWIGNPAKLSRAIAFSGSNWSQAMVAHIWGGHSRNLAIDPVRGVNSQSQVVTTKYNDFDNFSWLGLRQGSTQIFGLAKSPLNPVVTKTAFHDPDANDAQSAWRLQIATDISGTDVVWDSELIAGAGLTVNVDAENGTFLGSLADRNSLMPQKLYTLQLQKSSRQLG